MKTLFAMSLICGAASFLAALVVSAVTFAPGAESMQAVMIAVASFFGVVWLAFAFWIRPRRHCSAQSLPLWLQRPLTIVSIVYLFGIFVLVLG